MGILEEPIKNVPTIKNHIGGKWVVKGQAREMENVINLEWSKSLLARKEGG